jgi:DNA-binding Lrp family transcriptional regulator
MSRGRRSKMRGKARKTSYALDEEALEIFAEVAERLGISVSALLRMVARKLRSGEFKL